MKFSEPLFLKSLKIKISSAKADIDAITYAYIQHKMQIVEIGVRKHNCYGLF